MIDLAHGGGVQGVLDGLNRLLDIAVPAHLQEGGTYIVPGHGRVCDEADVLEYRDMVTIVRDRIKDMVPRGLTLQQVQAAMPTLDYDRTTERTRARGRRAMFVEAIYTRPVGARAAAEIEMRCDVISAALADGARARARLGHRRSCWRQRRRTAQRPAPPPTPRSSARRSTSPATGCRS